MSKFDFQQSVKWRFIAVLSLFFLIVVLIISRLFYISVIQNKYYKELAENQQSLNKVLPSKRGKIFFQDRFGNKKIAAFSADVYSIAVSPKLIKNPQDTASALSALFKKSQDFYISKLSKSDDPYEIIEKDISEEMIDSVNKLKIPGLVFVPSPKRFYPNARFGAHALGFVGFKNDDLSGLYGVEKQYEKEMVGEAGAIEGEKDASGFLLAIGKRIITEPVNGSDIVLTIDHNIQKKAEEELILTKEKWGAEVASILILDPKIGKILAMATFPAFDPNEYFKEKNYQIFKNPLIESIFELGSVFKPITSAGALNENLINPDTIYDDTGAVKIGGYTIKNFDNKAHGIQTVTQVLEKSLNTGAVFIQKILGKDKFKKYVDNFGFGRPTGIDLPGEVAGNISNLKYYRDIDYATASFGQGIAVTPIQMASAFAAIANKGKMMKPYIVDKLIDENGNEYVINPEEKGQIIKPETSEMLSKMLVSVVRNGFEGKAGVNGYFVAAKTGTAQIPSFDKRGYTTDVIHTFIGYAPAFNPKFLVYIQINKPSGNRFASNTLTIPFHNIIEYLLNYYEIPPDEK